MRRLAIAAAGGVLISLLSGCGIPTAGSLNSYGIGAYPKHSPVRGVLYTGVQGFEDVTENPVGPALPKMCVSGISTYPIPTLNWINVAWGSASSNGLDANKKVSVVDSDMFTVLGLFGQHCTVFHDGGSGPPAAVPAPPPGSGPVIPVPGPVNAPTMSPGAQPQPTAPQPPPGKTI